MSLPPATARSATTPGLAAVALVSLLALGCATGTAVRSGTGTHPAPDFVTREEWGASAPTAAMRTQTITRITIHHTGEPQDTTRSLEQKMRALQEFSQSAGTLAGGGVHHAWPDVPYHYYIGVDGRIAEGRDPRFAGDTNTTYDPAGHLLVVLEGNFQYEQPTAAQLRSLDALLLWAADHWHIPGREIYGHKDFASTACPGANLYRLLPELRQMVTRETGR